MEAATRLWEQKIDFGGNGYFAVATILSLIAAIIMIAVSDKSSDAAGVSAVLLVLSVVAIIVGLSVRIRRAKADAETQRAILRQLAKQNQQNEEIIERLHNMNAAMEAFGIMDPN